MTAKDAEVMSGERRGSYGFLAEVGERTGSAHTVQYGGSGDVQLQRTP
jgi:hypothetical protein